MFDVSLSTASVFKVLATILPPFVMLSRLSVPENDRVSVLTIEFKPSTNMAASFEAETIVAVPPFATLKAIAWFGSIDPESVVMSILGFSNRSCTKICED